jgi:DNA-binding response OmpR family regulator
MRIAVVEDDNDLATFLQGAMRELGHNCDHFPNGAKLVSALRRSTYDLILLDWHLPDTTGFELLQKIRAGKDSETGIIMLTSLSDKASIAEALRAGADDYIVKPESAAVIAARVEAVNRRSKPGRSSDRSLSFNNYEFDRLTETVRIDGDPVGVSSKEFALALLLFENIHRPLSRSYILETVWNADPNLSTRTLDMHISRIRSTLRLRPENGFRIASVSGYGYRLERFADGDGH